ncbi:hypothetical protein FOZ63_001275, partial [Perkinsus olseni]
VTVWIHITMAFHLKYDSSRDSIIRVIYKHKCHLHIKLAHTVEDIGNNDAVVRVVFPDDMTPLKGDVRYTLAITALPLPVDEVGWFPMRLGGAELTNSEDTYPHYTL